MAQVRAVLGPTNTGKTHLAIERMLGHSSGLIGLPLRLLAREVYDRICKAKGVRACALVTGEERIEPETARYTVATVEAMPLHRPHEFVCVDEIQLAADPDRGHIFTDRLLHARGTHETLFIGSETMRSALGRLGIVDDITHRERLSRLSYAGPIKITRLPRRTAVVAFSAEEVYAIAELLRRHRGGAAVVMGALSPRTRNAQVALYQSGEVDYLVATDAIGMGLNMDVDHVAFASRVKFDGHRRRKLRPDEMAQIAGRAGRFIKDGTFGETADCPPFEAESVQRIEEHSFEPITHIQWRNRELDFSSMSALIESLDQPAPEPLLLPHRGASDAQALRALVGDPEIEALARGRSAVGRVWEVCQLPDFRKTGEDAHARLVRSLVLDLAARGSRLSDAWMAGHFQRFAEPPAQIETLQQRLAEVRTLAYIAHREDWCADAKRWRNAAREVEDKLSDALHAALLARFVDRRTSALVRGLRADEVMLAGVSAEGEVSVEGHHVGRLDGLSFTPDSRAATLEGRAVRQAALKALRPEIARRLGAIAQAPTEDLSLGVDGLIRHGGAAIARLTPGTGWATPSVQLIGAEDAASPLRERAVAALTVRIAAETAARMPAWSRLKAALDATPTPVTGLARGLAFAVVEDGLATGLADLPGQISAAERQALAKVGVRVGQRYAWLAQGLTAAGLGWRSTLARVYGEVVALPPAAVPASFAVAAVPSRPALPQRGDPPVGMGYVAFGSRQVRVDMVERLLSALSEARRTAGKAEFTVEAGLAALIGCKGEDFPAVLRALGLTVARQDEAGKPVSWRFRSRTAARANGPPRASRTGPLPSAPRPNVRPDSPFAVLADRPELFLPQPAPVARKPARSRRRPPRAAPATPQA
jgi:ATP-dependent RNA helicase SUPV3L1/SUV3